jgi:hypothetical protein
LPMKTQRRKVVRVAVWCAVVFGSLYLAATAYRISRDRLDIWLPDYVSWTLAAAPTAHKPIHLFLFFTDHYEPASRAAIVERWVKEYPPFAMRHRDSGGRPVQHTWFYPIEQPRDEYLVALRGLVAAGYGEVELHLHHAYDDWDSALHRYQAGITYLQKFGFLKTVDNQTRFAFIHGNNSLDNSRGAVHCGVSRELSLLNKLGCFADFTFPNANDPAQPPLVNRIYDAVDNDRPKSYERGIALAVGRPPSGDLTIFTGPLVIRPTINPRKLFWEIDNGDLHPTYPARETRVDSWVRANIHVEGRPEWVFIKLSSHAAASDEYADEVLGPHFDRTLAYLESHYNDGRNYVLHYITAREAFNLARAAADGVQGDPAKYMDWIVKPYVANGARR